MLMFKYSGTSVSHRADFFHNLQLHRVPFLTTDVLKLLIPKMRNLNALGIYSCQLIHLGEAMKLIDIIKTDRPLEKENQVILDFFPTFHLGPCDDITNEYYTGSYGVTWDNCDYPTDRAVWCQVFQILTKARLQGQDFESKHTMIRQWLEKGPCHEVEGTIKALVTPTPVSEKAEKIKKELAELRAQKDVSKRKRQMAGKQLRGKLRLQEYLDELEHSKSAAAMVNYSRTQGDIQELKQHGRPNDWQVKLQLCRRSKR